MSKITQARARADRKELKDLQAKLYRIQEHSYPGTHIRNIGLTAETLVVLDTAKKLRNDLVYRFDPENSQLKAYAVRRS